MKSIVGGRPLKTHHFVCCSTIRVMQEMVLQCAVVYGHQWLHGWQQARPHPIAEGRLLLVSQVWMDLQGLDLWGGWLDYDGLCGKGWWSMMIRVRVVWVELISSRRLNERCNSIVSSIKVQFLQPLSALSFQKTYDQITEHVNPRNYVNRTCRCY